MRGFFGTSSTFARVLLVAALSLPLAAALSCVEGTGGEGADTPPVAVPAGLDAGSAPTDRDALGPSDEILFWDPEEQIAGYRNTELLYPTRVIEAGEVPFALSSRTANFSDLTYEVDGETFTLDEFVERHRVAGLLVLRGDDILLERYGLGNTEDSRWISFSIAKSVVSMLIGAAIEDGYIQSVDEPVTRYLPLLSGGGYDDVTIEQVLQMSSGVEWDETYDDPESDVASTPQGNLPFLEYMRERPRAAEPGEVFNYNTGETNLAGAVLRAAIGNNLATYLSSKIWQPFGMEHDAVWMLHEPGGGELGGCCISATLRDYGRLGRFALRGGVLSDGTRVLPEGWMEQSTAPSEGSEGYGYLWWLLGGDQDGDFAAIGIFGQLIFMDPEDDLVIVTHSAWPRAVGEELSAHRWAFVQALAEAARRVDVN